MPGQLIEQALLCGLATVAIGVVRDRQDLRRVHFPGFAPVFEAVADRRDKFVEQVGPRRPGREGLLVEQQFLGFRLGVGAIAAGRQQVVLVVGQFGGPGEPGGGGVVHRQPLEIKEGELILPLDQLLADAVFQPAARVAGGVGRGDQPGVRSQPTHQFADRLVLGEAVAQQGGCQVGTGEEAPIALGEAATAIGQPGEVGLDPGVVHPVVEVRQVPRDATGRFRHEGSASRKWIGMSGVHGSRFRPKLGVNRPRPSSGKPIVRRNLGFCHHSPVTTAASNGRPVLTIVTIAANAAATQPPHRRWIDSRRSRRGGGGPRRERFWLVTAAAGAASTRGWATRQPTRRSKCGHQSPRGREWLGSGLIVTEWTGQRFTSLQAAARQSRVRGGGARCGAGWVRGRNSGTILPATTSETVSRCETAVPSGVSG